MCSLFLLSLVLITIYLYIAINLIIHPDFFSTAGFQNISNNYCQTDYHRNPLDQLVCFNPIKKPKFIWFFFDGMAFDQTPNLRHFMATKHNLYKVNVDFFKQSGAIHEIYQTGKFSRNFIATQTQIDNLLQQFQQAGLRTVIHGKKYPMFTLGGYDQPTSRYYKANLEQPICDSYYQLVYEDMNFEKYRDWVKDKHKIKHQFDSEKPILNDHQIKQDWKQCFKQQNVGNKYQEKNWNDSNCLMHFNQLMDNYNHGFSKQQAITYARAYQQERLIHDISKWADDNPDYLVIASSDHGGQLFYGQDVYCTHGCNYEGNQGILYIYMKDFDTIQPIFDQNININSFDVSFIIASLVQNVNVPLESDGQVHPVIKDQGYLLVQYRMKEIQLKQLIRNFKTALNADNINPQFIQLDSFKHYQSIKKISSIFFKHQNISQEYFDQIIKDYQIYIQEMEQQIKLLRNSNQSKQKYWLQLAGLTLVAAILIQKYRSLYELNQISKFSLSVIGLILYSDNLMLLLIEYNQLQKLVEYSLYFNILLVLVLYIYDHDIGFKKDYEIYRSRTLQNNASNHGILNTSKMFYELVRLESQSANQDQSEDRDRDEQKQGFKQQNDSNDNDSNDNDKNRFKIQEVIVNRSNFLALPIVIGILLMVMVLGELMVSRALKQSEQDIVYLKQIDIVNYLLYMRLIYKQIKQRYQDYYLSKLSCVRMTVFQSSYYLVVTMMMSYYDYRNPRYFSHQTLEQVFLVKMIYILIVVNILIIVSNITIKLKQDRRFELIESAQTLIIPVITILFFVNDEMERLQFLLITNSCFLMADQFFRKDKNNKSRLFFLVMTIKLISYIYFYISGTYSFDTSIKAGNKTVAQEQDDAALFTGFLFGIQKFQAQILGSFVIFQFTKIKEKQNGNKSYLEYNQIYYLVVLINLSKMMLGTAHHLYCFFNQLDVRLLSAFMWNVSYLVQIVFVYLAVIMIQSIHTFKNAFRWIFSKRNNELTV